MLLIALAVFVGAFYIIHLKSMESKLVILGKSSHTNVCVYILYIHAYVLHKTSQTSYLMKA